MTDNIFCGYIGPCAHIMNALDKEPKTVETNQVSNTPTNDENNSSPTFSMEKIQEDILRRIKSNDLEGIYNLIDNAESRYFSDDKEYGVKLITYKDNRNIQHAAFLGRIEIVNYFLAKTVEVQSKAIYNGESPINRMILGIAQSNNVNTLEQLLDKIDMSKHGYCIFLFACSSGSMSIIKYCYETLKVKLPDPQYITEVNREVYDYLLSIGVVYDEYNMGLIVSHAAAENDLIFMKHLLENNVINPKYLCNGAKWAAQSGHLEALKYLYSIGVDINDAKSQGLIWASQHGQIEVIKYLVENGASFDAQEHQPIIYAINNGYLEVVKYLMYFYIRTYSDSTFRDVCKKIWSHKVSDGYYYGP